MNRLQSTDETDIAIIAGKPEETAEYEGLEIYVLALEQNNVKAFTKENYFEYI